MIPQPPPPVGGGGLKDRIKPAATGKVIAVTSNQEDTNNYKLVQEDYSEGSDRQLWNITKNSRGNYVIRPKSRLAYDKDYCMSAGDYVGITVPNGLNVNQRLYVDDTDLRDEWELSCRVTSWPSDDDAGYWENDPSIYYYNYDSSSSTFYFDGPCSFAEQQWENALGITISPCEFEHESFYLKSSEIEHMQQIYSVRE